MLVEKIKNFFKVMDFFLGKLHWLNLLLIKEYLLVIFDHLAVRVHILLGFRDLLAFVPWLVGFLQLLILVHITDFVTIYI